MSLDYLIYWINDIYKGSFSKHKQTNQLKKQNK